MPSSWGAKEFGEVGMLVSKEVDCLVRAAMDKDEQVSVLTKENERLGEENKRLEEENKFLRGKEEEWRKEKDRFEMLNKAKGGVEVPKTLRKGVEEDTGLTVKSLVVDVVSKSPEVKRQVQAAVRDLFNEKEEGERSPQTDCVEQLTEATLNEDIAEVTKELQLAAEGEGAER